MAITHTHKPTQVLHGVDVDSAERNMPMCEHTYLIELYSAHSVLSGAVQSSRARLSDLISAYADSYLHDQHR